ncbi:hypothetical protein AAFF_G00213930 [Aldrovandia affinis]|uniref:cGMP-dependent protein kinase interacting domain-containing protein n=1 Tax=Aldrovandia affinis TaxID=143900 RepID=A0AAD7RGP2_9TELE|nr:hypothetical protein AAFF_G00213930 [Aldrovandia affinis]
MLLLLRRLERISQALLTKPLYISDGSSRDSGTASPANRRGLGFGTDDITAGVVERRCQTRLPPRPLPPPRASELDSGTGTGTEDSATDRLLGRASSYTRRENRLASLNKADDEASSKDYKKMYEDALAENEKLKSRLEDSKQDLAKIRTQLERVTQKQDRISERSSVLETEKREKRILEKKVSEMEEELKVLTELKSDNQRLKDENGALIRVISKLSK